jgi:hypothetical protein
MPGDVNRLFSMINQANLPYQVFEQAALNAQAVQSETPVAPPADDASKSVPANEDKPAYAGFLQAYAEPQPLEAPQGVVLADLFRRMAAAR